MSGSECEGGQAKDSGEFKSGLDHTIVKFGLLVGTGS
jgi:hypothetical protein